MAAHLLVTSPHSSLLFSPSPTKQPVPFLSSSSLSLPIPSIPRPTTTTRPLRLRSILRPHSSLSDDPYPGDDPPEVTDEWGEKADPEPESAYTKLSASDPPKDDDEWGRDGYAGVGIGGADETPDDDEETKDAAKEKLLELKRCLVDSVYGTELGFRARLEERAEILELVNQLEALNPTPAPTESPELLDGDWVLL